MTISMEETNESKGTELVDDEMTKEEEDGDEQPSPRGVLEIPVSGSDSDNNSTSGSSSSSSSRSIGSGSSVPEKSVAHGLHWRNLFDSKRWKSLKQFSTRKNLKKKVLGRIQSADNEFDCGDLVVPRPSWRNFSQPELAAATDNFSSERLIGKGGHAEVYKGCLADGKVVAVKRITRTGKNHPNEDRVGDFLAELGIIAHINHPNAAKLIGFSVDGGLHLVLQFSPLGSLASVLHGAHSNLDWKMRFKVALGIAEGLQYLHCECQRRIIHRDITASNILLTEEYEPQISDFGLAKWLPGNWVHHIAHPIEGTFGYMAPEYFMHGIVDEKTDVFAFGVLLLELITGRHAIDSRQQSLVLWATPLLEKHSVKEIADPRLRDVYDVGEIKRAMVTALACLHHLPSLRPNMERVVQLLRGEGGQLLEFMKQKSAGGGGRAVVILDDCDLEDYTNTCYLNDLNRHMQLVME